MAKRRRVLSPTDTFERYLRVYRLPDPKKEYRFDDKRRWRADYAWPDLRVLVEIEGGTWQGGRHTRPQGYENDCEKYNAATAGGWRVFRFTSDMVYSGQAGEFMRGVFNE